MSYFPDMGNESMVAVGEHVRAIGWLHPDHPKGDVPAEFLARLKTFVAMSGLSGRALYFGAFAGVHTCEFCGKAWGIANFGVPADEILFVAPEMVVHYIEQHDYLPPAEFIDAVMRCPLPDTEDYQILTEPFWQMHRAMIERITRGQ